VLFLATVGLSFSGTLVFTGVDSPAGLGSATSTNGWLDVSGSDQDVYWYGGMSVTVNGYSRTLFCIDLSQDIYVGSTNATDITVPTSGPQQQAAWLLTQYWTDLTTPPTVVIGTTSYNATTQEAGAAIQLALWDVMSNGSGTLNTTSSIIGLSVNGTNPTTTATDPVVAALAQSMITNSIGKVSTNAMIYNNVCTANAPVCDVTSQMLISITYNDGGPSAPEPSTVWLCLTGGLIAGIARQFNQRKLARSGTSSSL
jgi:hypothetical protein